MTGRSVVKHIIAVALCLTAASAWAGDYATFSTIGFSEDGSVYAFEEYGVQDGSGFAYANRYFIDTETDSYLPGTPIRVQLRQDSSSVAEARRQAAEQSEGLVSEYGLENNPGKLVAFNPVTEISSDPFSITYHWFPIVPHIGGPGTLTLETVPFPSSDTCKSYGLGDTTPGFRLVRTQINGEPANEVVYEDDGVPSSRGCPRRYRLGGIVTQPFANSVVHAILVLVQSHGFEGLDGRWIAVMRRFDR